VKRQDTYEKVPRGSYGKNGEKGEGKEHEQPFVSEQSGKIGSGKKGGSGRKRQQAKRANHPTSVTGTAADRSSATLTRKKKKKNKTNIKKVVAGVGAHKNATLAGGRSPYKNDIGESGCNRENEEGWDQKNVVSPSSFNGIMWLPLVQREE